MATILLVSKPVEPPWNDSSKNLVRDLVLGMTRHDSLAFGRQGWQSSLGRARLEPVHPAGTAAFAPGLGDQVRVLKRLAFGARTDLWHFFFAPNPKTSTVARSAAALRRARTVQTVCSVPRAVTDAAHREVLGAQAREAALAEYDRGRMARAYEALYDAVSRG
jgi:hypothetical protein